MANEKTPHGNVPMLVLNLLQNKDMYGYQIIEELRNKSNNVFNLKSGSLYPVLHNLEKDGLVTSYDGNTSTARVRRYYSITKAGTKSLHTKKEEWASYTQAINNIILDFAGGEVAYGN